MKMRDYDVLMIRWLGGRKEGLLKEALAGIVMIGVLLELPYSVCKMDRWKIVQQVWVA